MFRPKALDSTVSTEVANNVGNQALRFPMQNKSRQHVPAADLTES
jgi:hypothetical protein